MNLDLKNTAIGAILGSVILVGGAWAAVRGLGADGVFPATKNDLTRVAEDVMSNKNEILLMQRRSLLSEQRQLEITREEFVQKRNTRGLDVIDEQIIDNKEQLNKVQDALDLIRKRALQAQ